jgi:hypothetical protein
MGTGNIFPKLSLFYRGNETISLIPITARDFFHYFIFFILLLIFIWLLIREIRCWYWKINYRIKIQEEINENIKDIKILLVNQLNLEEDGKDNNNNNNNNFIEKKLET